MRHTPTIGIIANPVSARDIRRVIANASNLQVADRVNIVMRVLACGGGSCGIESGADDARQRRHPSDGWGAASQRERSGCTTQFPQLESPRHGRERRRSTTRSRPRAGCARRASRPSWCWAAMARIVRSCANAAMFRSPAFPPAPITRSRRCGNRRSRVWPSACTLSGQALRAEQALAPNKLLEVSINDGERRDIALVDTVICSRTLHRRARPVENKTCKPSTSPSPTPKPSACRRSPACVHPVGRRDPRAASRVMLGPRRRSSPPGAAGADRAGAWCGRLTLAGWQPGWQPDVPPLDGGSRDAGIVALDGERDSMPLPASASL